VGNREIGKRRDSRCVFCAYPDQLCPPKQDAGREPGYGTPGTARAMHSGQMVRACETCGSTRHAKVIRSAWYQASSIHTASHDSQILTGARRSHRTASRSNEAGANPRRRARLEVGTVPTTLRRRGGFDDGPSRDSLTGLTLAVRASVSSTGAGLSTCAGTGVGPTGLSCEEPLGESGSGSSPAPTCWPACVCVRCGSGRRAVAPHASCAPAVAAPHR
jgi:hypothetical protein